MRTPIAFIFGALAATLVAAAAFRGAGQPLDSTFTYQGQLRNAGQLVNGNVDVRFTLWDSDVGGIQIGNANSFTNYPLTDGRFALGLNFGTGAFNGDQRWVQIEFRDPAGTGQYLTLTPRDKILATPYALYALNSTASQWDYNPKTQALTSAQNVSRIGIGTTTPTAALEVVAAGGDDAVKLPAGSIGIAELTPEVLVAASAYQGSASLTPPHGGGYLVPVDRVISLLGTGVLTCSGTYVGPIDVNYAPFMGAQLIVDGDVVQNSINFEYRDYDRGTASFAASVSIGPGAHSIQVRCSRSFSPCSGNCLSYQAAATLQMIFTPSEL